MGDGADALGRLESRPPRSEPEASEGGLLPGQADPRAHAIAPAVILLAAGLVAILLARPLRVSPIFGFIAAGVAIGEHGLRVIEEGPTGWRPGRAGHVATEALQSATIPGGEGHVRVQADAAHAGAALAFERRWGSGPMKPWELLGETRTPDGKSLALTRRGNEYVIHADGKSLMSSRMHGSEEALAVFACRQLGARAEPCVLIGGLGMGFTLRATLDLLPRDATVVVAELVPAVVAWNRGPLGPLAGHPLADERVRLEVCDVADVLRASRDVFDAVLFDVDNGPRAFTARDNSGLYDDRGLAAARAALEPDGTLAVWSAWDDRKFEQRLRHAGFEVEVKRVRGRLKKGGPVHTIFLARPRPRSGS